MPRILFTGGSPGPHLEGGLGGSGRRVSRPTPRDEVGRCGWGLQAHTWGVSRPTPEGVLSQHALRQTLPPPNQTATAAGGTHPTGMHSCIQSSQKTVCYFNLPSLTLHISFINILKFYYISFQKTSSDKIPVDRPR